MSVDESFKDRLIAEYGDVIADQLAKIIQECMDAGGSSKKIEKCIKKKIEDQNIAVDDSKVGAKTMGLWVSFG